MKPYNTLMQGHVTNENHYISTARFSMATKLGKMVTYFDWVLPMKLHDDFINLSYDIT